MKLNNGKRLNFAKVQNNENVFLKRFEIESASVLKALEFEKRFKVKTL